LIAEIEPFHCMLGSELGVLRNGVRILLQSLMLAILSHLVATDAFLPYPNPMARCLISSYRLGSLRLLYQLPPPNPRPQGPVGHCPRPRLSVLLLPADRLHAQEILPPHHAKQLLPVHRQHPLLVPRDHSGPPPPHRVGPVRLRRGSLLLRRHFPPRHVLRLPHDCVRHARLGLRVPAHARHRRLDACRGTSLLSSARSYPVAR
jgi:hypothetical protein